MFPPIQVSPQPSSASKSDNATCCRTRAVIPAPLQWCGHSCPHSPVLRVIGGCPTWTTTRYQQTHSGIGARLIPRRTPPRPIRNFSFGVGETLHYDIGWQSIVAGKGQMVVNAPVDTNQRLCFPVVSTVESTPFFSTFYRVDDSAVSFIDVRQIYPVRFEKYLREGKYRSDQIADFDPTTGQAYTPKDTIDIPAYVQDALSLLYYVRTLEMKPETEFTVDNFTGKKSYTLTVRILHRERIEVKAGTFSTIVVEPLLQAAGLFKQEGKLKVWLTDDRLHLPVLMKSKVLVGSIVAELTDYRLGTVRRYSP
ncbi:MAG: DUF3108 domain-containing protein [candidate division Zixibacteria bacterium]|nr:DUF3108 domain-containing protein [candidate division Zixibacteria bacterium]